MSSAVGITMRTVSAPAVSPSILLTAGLLVVTAGGCGEADDDPPSQPADTGAATAADTAIGCTPGNVVACACPGGREGMQQCRDDRTWEICDCESDDTGGSPSTDALSDAGMTDASWRRSDDRERILVAKRIDDGEVTPDGDFEEPVWEGTMEVEVVDESGRSDNQFTVRSLWDDETLYVGFSVRDGDLASNSSVDIWRRDSLELFLDTDRDRGSDNLRSDDYHVIVDAENRTRITRGGGTDKTVLEDVGLQTAVTRTDDGYRVEMAVPADTFELDMTQNERFGLLVANNDRENGERHPFAWGQLETFTIPDDWGDLRLGGTSPTDSDDQ